MKYFFLIFVLFAGQFSFAYCAERKMYEVIKIIDGDTIYVDFNNNKIIEQNEKVRLNGIDSFETRINSNFYYQTEKYNLNENEVFGLGYYGKEFAKKELLNKYVYVKYTAKSNYDKNNRKLMSVYYDCKNDVCKSYEEEILKQGYAVIFSKSNIKDDLKQYENPDKIKYRARKTHKLNLVILNKNTKTYHNLFCPHAQNLSNSELIKKPKFRYKKAKCCH